MKRVPHFVARLSASARVRTLPNKGVRPRCVLTAARLPRRPRTVFSYFEKQPVVLIKTGARKAAVTSPDAASLPLGDLIMRLDVP